MQSRFSMFAKVYKGIFAHQNKNSGTNLPFPSLLTPSIFAKQKQEEEPSMFSQIILTFQPINLVFNECNSQGGGGGYLGFQVTVMIEGFFRV